MSDKTDHLLMKKANRYFTIKILINAGLMVLGILLITFILNKMQEESSLAKQKEDSVIMLAEVAETLEKNAEDAQELTTIYHYENQATVSDFTEMMQRGLWGRLLNASNQERADVFKDMTEHTGVSYLLVVNQEDKVMVAPDVSYYGKDLVALKMLTKENAAQLLQGTRQEDGQIRPVYEKNEFGEFYFYSEIIKYDGISYSIVIGYDVADLAMQLDTLKDTARILQRASSNTAGFLFAVDRTNECFLYYENEQEILTGTNVKDSGLSQAALNDGYAGKEKINGVEYYCVSKAVGNDIIISAVVTTEYVFKSNHNVIIWPVIGFILVMCLCLAYVVIVRNDFVRNETPTKKIRLLTVHGNNVHYDHTLGSKVFPLMLFGILIIFGISFFTQTLLEISDAVSESKSALQEAGIRYEEAQINRETITNYYTSQFLSKARLMSYLLEEDPSVLNEETSRIYSTYTDTGEKVPVFDNEGNTLRSVASSQVLIDLCQKNALDSIYIYDDQGHTIATSTSNWYFTLSMNPEQPSFSFRNVLDGKVDEMVQEPILDEMGTSTQYIGVAFDYYTTTNFDGETVYLSRYDYENRYADVNQSPISIHHSLIQIGLKSELIHRLLNSTNMDYIFSMDTLSGGFILIFDDSEQHRVIYSPVESSIGKSAAEIGISAAAFSDGYYGFQKMNGITYLQYVRYGDGFFAATSIPKSQMYHYRMIISIVTSLISFILLMILSITVTFTNDDEEKMYALITKEMKEHTDASVFRILLPSGKTTSTVKASARWDNRSIPWKERSPEQKLLLLVSVLFGLLLLVILISVFSSGDLLEEESIVSYILHGRWERGLNVFSYSACFLVLVITIVGMQLVRIPVRLVTSILGTRSETLGHLVMSIVKYGGTLASLFYCLYLLGLDASSLLASAGILSLVIGLGAQSLIKDILAGVFIVFEGEFRVGDIVTIRDFRGTVMDIGLRTTKIINGMGNIQIYNNSEISSVLNMTKQLSIAGCTIGIEYGQDLEVVEEVLKKELPDLKNRIPQIVEGPFYGGVAKLSESSVDLSVSARCKEADVFSVTRQLNRELYLIFTRNHISIPFNNITVSYLNEEKK